MGVIMQAFYWDCPRCEGKEFLWWRHVTEQIPTLKKAGFTALWLPPASKGANIGGMSMGYDPYDYYDLGEYDQKGSVPTWFGSRADLEALIAEAHKTDADGSSMQIYADLVLNHSSGADEEETNPLTNKTLWTKYSPKSGKFQRDWQCFHPSPYRASDEEAFSGMTDLCHHNPYVYGEFMKLSRRLVEEIGFDGFRYDFVKGFGMWMINAIQGQRYVRAGERFKPFGVGECWDAPDVIEDWLAHANAVSDNPVRAFDFPLRGRLKELCDNPQYNLRNFPHPGTLLTSRPSEAVTFVENHDIVRDHPIVNDKMLAYAVILTHEGYPCVFWQDYFPWGLAQEGTPNGIERLARIHEDYAGGLASILWIEERFYMMQRSGWGDQKGLMFVLNTGNDGWQGRRVQTRWRNTTLKPMAWWGASDKESPEEKITDGSGYAELWAPPRGYAVYVPET